MIKFKDLLNNEFSISDKDFEALLISSVEGSKMRKTVNKIKKKKVSVLLIVEMEEISPFELIDFVDSIFARALSVPKISIVGFGEVILVLSKTRLNKKQIASTKKTMEVNIDNQISHLQDINNHMTRN